MVQVPTFQAGAAPQLQIRGANLRQVQQPDIGAAISDVGGVIGDIALTLQKAENARVLNRETAIAERGLAKFSLALQNGDIDPSRWEEEHNKFTENVLSKAKEKMNSAVFDSFSASYLKSSTSSFIDTIHAARKKNIDSGVADLNSTLGIYKDLYATSRDGEKRKSILGQAMISISDAKNTNLISSVQAQSRMADFLQSSEETRLENDLNSDPTLAQANFEEGEYKISEESKPAYFNKIETAVMARESERIRLYEKNERDKEKALKLEQEALEIDFREKLINNELSDTEIIRAGQNRRLSAAQVKSLLSDNNKTDKYQSDPEEYDRILKQVLANQLSTDQILENPDLSSMDKKTFTGMITRFRDQEDKAKATQRNEDEKNISAGIRPFIITTGPLAQFVKSDEQILYQSAIEEMRERLDAGEDKERIKLDIISRYSRVPVSTDQLPRLRFGTEKDLNQAKTILVDKLNSNQITLAEAERQAELIKKYEEAIRNQEELARLNKESGGRK